MQPRLTRTRSDRMIAGVCGGLGHYFGVDPVIVRLIFVVLAVTTFVTPLIYPLLWLIMPEAEQPTGMPQRSHPDPAISIPPDARFDPMTGEPLPPRGLGALPPQSSSYQEPGVSPPPAVPASRSRTFGLVLLAIGGIILVNNIGSILSHIVGIDVSGLIFPLLLVGVGVYLLRNKTT